MRSPPQQQLVIDLASREMAVSRTVAGPITQGQFNALVSFLYTVGLGKQGGGTLKAYAVYTLDVNKMDEQSDYPATIERSIAPASETERVKIR